MHIERKQVHFEIKSDAMPGTIQGCLSRYGNIDLVGDVCEPGCFDDSLQKRTIYPTLWQHDQVEPIGHFTATDSKDGLMIQGSLNQDVQRGREAYSLIKNGDISGLSIGYTPDEFVYDKDGIRHLTKVTLWEGSVVTFPANPEASVEAKNMNEKGHMIRKDIGGYLSKLPIDERKAAAEEFLKQIEACTEDEEDARKADTEEEGEEGTEDETSTEEEDDTDTEEDPEEGMKSISVKLKDLCEKLEGIL